MSAEITGKSTGTGYCNLHIRGGTHSLLVSNVFLTRSVIHWDSRQLPADAVPPDAKAVGDSVARARRSHVAERRWSAFSGRATATPSITPVDMFDKLLTRAHTQAQNELDEHSAASGNHPGLAVDGLEVPRQDHRPANCAGTTSEAFSSVPAIASVIHSSSSPPC